MSVHYDGGYFVGVYCPVFLSGEALVTSRFLVYLSAIVTTVIGDEFTFNDLFDPQYKPRHLVSTWMPGIGTHFVDNKHNK